MKKRFFSFGFLVLTLTALFMLTTSAISDSDVVSHSAGVFVCPTAGCDGISIMSNNNQNVITFSSFNVAAFETVQFDSNDYAILVKGVEQSKISGRICGEGNIYIINPNGVIFDNTSSVNVKNLYVSTRPIDGTNWDDYDKPAEKVGGDITCFGHVQANEVTFEANNVILNADEVRLTKSTQVLAEGSIDCGISCSHGERAQTKLEQLGNINFKFLNGKSHPATAYYWVRNVYELQNMKNNPYDNYMLANEIDGSPYQPFEPIPSKRLDPICPEFPLHDGPTVSVPSNGSVGIIDIDGPGSVLSDGSVWIIVGGAVAVIAIATILVVRKKKKPARSDTSGSIANAVNEKDAVNEKNTEPEDNSAELKDSNAEQVTGGMRTVNDMTAPDTNRELGDPPVPTPVRPLH